MLSYVDVFDVLMIVVFASVPLLLLMRRPSGATPRGGAP